MPSEHQSADPRNYQPFPDIENAIDENPARFLDRDLLSSTPVGQSNPKEFVFARIDGIDFLAVAESYLYVELNLSRAECPRAPVVAKLNERIQWLREHGDRPRGEQYDHDAIPSTESVAEWDTDDGKQRTGARVNP